MLILKLRVISTETPIVRVTNVGMWYLETLFELKISLLLFNEFEQILSKKKKSSNKSF